MEFAPTRRALFIALLNVIFEEIDIFVCTMAKYSKAARKVIKYNIKYFRWKFWIIIK